MLPLYIYVIAFIIAFTVTIVSTPFVKKLAIKIGATDRPETRKVHEKIMPRLGGLAIVLGFVAGILVIRPESQFIVPIMMGAFIIVVLGILDDKYTLRANSKLVGQILAASVVVFSGLKIDMINLPFTGEIYFGIWSYPFTILWIVGITNAINLIDGLDGLAAGVSSIALTSILVMAVLDGQLLAIALSVVLIGSTLGFLVHNFYPAKIFMGDTGSLFLGYLISVISITGLFKNLTFISLVIPVIILAIPIFDTLFAIIRRIVNKKKISAPDKKHLHYCLLEMGFSHRKTVLIIYGVSAFFGISAIIFSTTAQWLSVFIILFLLLVIQISAELVGIMDNKKKPLINFFMKMIKYNSVRNEPKYKR
ncbi:glycosyltransferase family 4 protein [Alkalihalobacterium alkalinitrilicum]|uniref:glycosyltransferase family 4 protein n=1 Tax=Alkalihalobacterium alkalinitrilicum TaxID=427920 RepID=UPI000995467C|nr:MraY family glycosyltransferase [Alkalihalobacterium alkalinitrilicum]